MRVLITVPGHLRTVPMGTFCASALRRLGHEVILFDHRPHWLDKAGRAVGVPAVHGATARVANARLVRLAQRERPDLFLALFGFDISEETIRTFRSLGILTACWWLNDPFQLPRSLRQASWYDWYFTNARGCLEEYWNAGVGAARFLPLAADVDVHRPPHLTREDGAHYASEVCFAGDWSPLREDWVSRLLARHLVRVWGPWGKKLAPDSPVRRVLADGFFTPAEMVRAFAGAKVVLNLHTWFGKWSFGVNPRLFEAAGVGACQFVDRKDEIPDLYRVPEEVVCFESFEECERLLDYYLARDAERGAIGARASLRTHREHTYDARMRMLLGVVGGGMAARPSVE